METIKPQCITMIDDILYELDKIGLPVMFVGDGITVQKEHINEVLAVEHHFAPASVNRQKAASLAALASIYYREDRVESAREHCPEYLRLSQAEQELKDRQNENK